MKILQTPSGVRFGLLGEKPAAPAPTLFVMTNGLEPTVLEEDKDLNESGLSLLKRGWLNVALNMPCHGDDVREGETRGNLTGWVSRLNNGENIAQDMARQASDTLDYLVAEGYTDAGRVAVSGSSRGAFMALHISAADARFRKVVAFAALTDLRVLWEFKDMQDHALTASLDPVELAEKLVGREIWFNMGVSDERVSTDHAYATVRAIAAANVRHEKPVTVEMHLCPGAGHISPPGCQQAAAAWLLR